MYNYERMRMLLSQCEAACRDGWLTRNMLDDTVREAMSLPEPLASDLRNLLGSMRPGVTPVATLCSRLRQAQTVLNTAAIADKQFR